MHKENSRLQRIEGALTKQLAELVRTELNDPRIGMITISCVRVSKDLAHAKVYFSSIDAPQNFAEITSALNKAKGHLRSLLAKKSHLRTVPALKFIYDDSSAISDRMLDLIQKTIQNIDEQ